VIEAALFDFDGTLVDTTELIYHSMRHAVREVMGLEPPREVLLANVGQPLPRQMELLVETVADGRPDRERLADRLLEVYVRDNIANHDALIREFPGVVEALSRLQDAGLKVAVVTSKSRASVEMALRAIPSLGGVTDRFVTMEDTAEHKPHPAPLLKGLELLGGVPPERAVYVGDSPHDVAAAHAARMRCIAVSWGAFSEDVLRDAGPEYLVPDVGSAADVILKLREARQAGTGQIA